MEIHEVNKTMMKKKINPSINKNWVVGWRG
jgi:hypothetical protein